MVNEDSLIIECINYYLQIEINFGLVSYGGQVSLVDVVEDNIVVLCFGGGCQGCGMVDMIFKDGVEKILIECIFELKGVCDVIDYSNKENVYY